MSLRRANVGCFCLALAAAAAGCDLQTALGADGMPPAADEACRTTPVRPFLLRWDGTTFHRM